MSKRESTLKSANFDGKTSKANAVVCLRLHSKYYYLGFKNRQKAEDISLETLIAIADKYNSQPFRKGSKVKYGRNTYYVFKTRAKAEEYVKFKESAREKKAKRARKAKVAKAPEVKHSKFARTAITLAPVD